MKEGQDVGLNERKSGQCQGREACVKEDMAKVEEETAM